MQKGAYFALRSLIELRNHSAPQYLPIKASWHALWRAVWSGQSSSGDDLTMSRASEVAEVLADVETLSLVWSVESTRLYAAG